MGSYDNNIYVSKTLLHWNIFELWFELSLAIRAEVCKEISYTLD